MASPLSGESATAGLTEKLLDKNSGDIPSSHQQEADTVEEQHDVLILNDALPTGSVETGEKQEDRFRDAWAAALFVGHLVAMFYLAFAWGIRSLTYEETSSPSPDSSYTTTEEIHFAGLLYLALTSSLAALVLAAVSLSVMMRFAEQLVQFSLLFSVLCNFALIVVFAMQGFWPVVIFNVVLLLLGGCYVYLVWKRIPFAASNLKTALTAIRTNGGISMVAYGVTAAVFLFSIVWILAWLGVYVRSATCKDGECTSHLDAVVVISFLLSYYWTSEVGKNLLHVTVSGVVGTWWFVPDDASRFCSPAISDSLLRACTYSLGSICLGSLLTAVLQVLYTLANEARRNGRGNSLVLCIVECIVGCLERVVAYFNKWAYTYIGLYGYDYLTAGKKVMNLFTERGWSVIIQDDLVVRVLRLVSVVLGLITGALGLLLARLFPSWVDEFGSPGDTVVAFFVPFIVGTAISYILMSVVASAVDTVIVSFAEAPREFEQNHPGLHQQMVLAWRQVYPDEFTM